MSDFTQKEKIAIVIEDGMVSAVYSSLSPKVIDVQIFDMDIKSLETEDIRAVLDKQIESGELPHNIF